MRLAATGLILLYKNKAKEGQEQVGARGEKKDVDQRALFVALRPSIFWKLTCFACVCTVLVKGACTEMNVCVMMYCMLYAAYSMRHDDGGWWRWVARGECGLKEYNKQLMPSMYPYGNYNVKFK